MNDQPLVNKTIIMKNKETKSVWKAARHYYSKKKRHEQPLKSALYKVVCLCEGEVAVHMTKQASSSASSASCPSESTLKADTTRQWTEKRLIELVKDSALTGMSGNGFPVYQKLEAFLTVLSAVKQPVFTVIAVHGTVMGIKFWNNI